MKKSILLVIGVVLVLAVAVLAACEANIDNGQIDIDKDILEQYGTVEVKGLEGVSGTATVKPVEETAKATAMTAVKNVYYVADGAETYAVDIKILDNDGKEVEVGKPVTVSIELKTHALPLDQYVVFHVHDGKADEIVPTVDGDKLTFTVDSFSPFIVVPKHVHAYGEWTVYNQPDCLNGGVEIRRCACGASETRDFGAPLGHVDADGDGLCDRCETSLHVHAYGEWGTYSEATCTEAKVEMRRCACGAVETRDVGEALGHDMTHHAMVSESCTEDGNVEYFSCSRCKKFFLEAEGTTEITLANTVVPATGHVDKNEDGVCDTCGADLNQAPEEVPCTVEAAGAEGTVVSLTVQNVDNDQKQAAILLAKDAYYFEDDAEFVVVDISPEGQIAQGVPVVVSVKLKEPKLALDQYIVLHVRNGAVEELEPTVDGECLTFRVTSFSPFVFGPKHIHAPGPSVTIENPTCTKDGTAQVSCIKCHKVLSTSVVPAPGHVDENEDGTCDVCGATIQKEPDTPYGYVEGKVFAFDRAEGEGINPATYATAYAQATFSFFEDNYMEYHEYSAVAAGNIRANNMVLCGTYTMAADEAGYVITLSVNKRYYDDEETMIPISTYTFVYDVANAAVLEEADDYMGHVASLYFTEDTEATLTPYAPPALADNWDGSVITAAFNAVGATKTYTLPKLDNVLSMSKGDVYTGRVTVTIAMSSKMQGAAAAGQYKTLLESQYYNYTFGESETRLNTDDNLFWFALATGYSNGYPTLTITIGAFEAAYPDAGIDNFLEEQGMTDAFPWFTTPWAMDYHFAPDASPALAVLIVTLRYREGEQHDEDVASQFTTLLKSVDYGYQEKEAGDKTYLCSPNGKTVLQVVIGKGSFVGIYIYSDAIFYPAEAIAEYLKGTEDTFLDLNDDSVFGYVLYTNEEDNPTGIRLVGKFPSSVDAHLFVGGLEAAYADAGYKWGGFATHFGNEDDVALYHHAWISANQEIAVIFAAFNQDEHELGDFSYYSVSIVNMTKIAAANKAFMTSLHAAGHQTTVDAGATYTFNGGITYMYTNVSTNFDTAPAYTDDFSLVDIGVLDTSTPGTRTFRISLKGNADIYVDVPITVMGLTGISATANLPKIDDRYTYYSAQYTLAQDYTITRHYADGHSDTVNGKDASITFGDIDGSKPQQDLTISCTLDGVTVSTTVAIGLFKSLNYTCTNDWNINADNATFAILAKGGTYGEIGCWVAVNVQSMRDIVFIGNVYVDAEGIYIARISPALDVFGSTFYGLDTEGIWNKSAYIELPDSGSSGNFAFL